MNGVQLVEAIRESFSLEEIRELYWDLNIRYDDLPGITVSQKARELVSFCIRVDRVDQLITILCGLRPHVNWEWDGIQTTTGGAAKNLRELYSVAFREEYNGQYGSASAKYRYIQEIDPLFEGIDERIASVEYQIINLRHATIGYRSPAPERVPSRMSLAGIFSIFAIFVLLSGSIIVLWMNNQAAIRISEAAATETAVAIAVIPSTNTPTFEPAETNTPLLTVTSTNTPLPMTTSTHTPLPMTTSTRSGSVPPSIRCDDPRIVPGIFPQLANELTFSFASYRGEGFECIGVFDHSNTMPPSVKLDYDPVGYSFAAFVIDIQGGLDISSFDELCLSVYTNEPEQRFNFGLRGTTEVEGGFLITTLATDQWDKYCVPLDSYPDSVLTDIQQISLSFNNILGSAAIWVDDFEFR